MKQTEAHARLELLIRRLDATELREIICAYLNENTTPQDLVYFSGKVVEQLESSEEIPTPHHLCNKATLIRLALWTECAGKND